MSDKHVIRYLDIKMCIRDSYARVRNIFHFSGQ